jgi:hypothetical protein
MPVRRLARISGVPTEISFIDYKYRVELIILFILGFNNHLRVDQANKNGGWEMIHRGVWFMLVLFPISVFISRLHFPTVNQAIIMSRNSD